MSKLNSVCVILSGALGDLVRGLSVAVAIKEQSPETRVTWLVDSTWYSIVEHHPAVDEILVFDRQRPFAAIPGLVTELRQREFDVTLDMQRHLKSGICSFFSGAKRRIGFHPENCKEGNQFFNTEYIPVQSDAESKLNHYFAFLEALGLQAPEVVDFGFSEMREEDMVLDPATDRVRLGMVLSSSWETKDWPVTGYQQLIAAVSQLMDCEIVLLGTGSDEEKAGKLVENSGEASVINMAGRTNLRQLLEVVRSCTACIGPDSGPGHLAAAVGTPYVSLFGPTPAERVAPFQNEHLVVVADVPCRPCSRKKCPGLDTACMRLISPHEVMTTLQPLLQS